MNRFKYSNQSLKNAIKFIKTTKGQPPSWVTKHRDDLVVKGSKLFFNDREIISRERVQDVLRKEIYKVGGTVPSGRDSAFHICKKRYVGISRRGIMEFIRGQKPLGEVKAALNKPKQTSGERLKNYTFETDLIFLKKTDLEKANKKFVRDDTSDLTYFLSTVEKVTGLSRFDHVLTKDPNIVTPLVVKHCKDIAKQLKTTTSKCEIRTDRGGEFNHNELEKHFKKATFVNSGVSVENKNAQFQKCFFQILRQRKATDIEDATKQSEKLLNNTFNRIHKKTSNELVERGDVKLNLKEYNDKRKTLVAGDKRKPFEVGEYVRILEPKKKRTGIDYKRYKNKTYGERVFIVKKITKKTFPRKYWVDGRWRLQSDLLKSLPRDKKSLDLVEERDDNQKNERKRERKEHLEKRFEEVQKEEAKKKEPIAKDAPIARRRSSRAAAARAKVRMLQSKAANEQIDDMLDDDEKKPEKKEVKNKQVKNKPLRPKRTPQHKAMIRFLKMYKLPSGGSLEVLGKRIVAFKKKNPNWKKMRPTVRKV